MITLSTSHYDPLGGANGENLSYGVGFDRDDDIYIFDDNVNISVVLVA